MTVICWKIVSTLEGEFMANKVFMSLRLVKRRAGGLNTVGRSTLLLRALKSLAPDWHQLSAVCLVGSLAQWMNRN